MYDLQDLKKLKAEYENVLHLLNIDYQRLTPAIEQYLEKCVTNQLETGVHCLHEETMDLTELNHKAKSIDLMLKKRLGEMKKEKLDKSLQDLEAAHQQLENFAKIIPDSKQSLQEAEFELTVAMKSMSKLQKPEDEPEINFEELLTISETLEQLKATKKN